SNPSERCPPMNPAAPVTQTLDITPPSPPPKRSLRRRRPGNEERERDPAGRPAFRRGEPGAVAGVGVQLVLARGPVPRRHGKDLLRILRPPVARRPCSVVG